MQFQIVLAAVISVLVTGVSAHSVVSCRGDGGVIKGGNPYDNDYVAEDDFKSTRPVVIEDDFQPNDDYVADDFGQPQIRRDSNTYNYNYNYYNKRPNQKQNDYDYQTDAPVTTQAPTQPPTTQPPTKSPRHGDKKGRNDFGIGVRIPNLLDPFNLFGGAGGLNARVGIEGLGRGGLLGGGGLGARGGFGAGVQL